MRIFVTSADPFSTSHCLDVHPSDSVLSLKTLIEDRQHIRVSDQFLMCGCKPLQDHLTMAIYNIHEGATIHLNVRLRGGSSPDIMRLTRTITPEPELESPSPINVTNTNILTDKMSPEETKRLALSEAENKKVNYYRMETQKPNDKASGKPSASEDGKDKNQNKQVQSRSRSQNSTERKTTGDVLPKEFESCDQIKREIFGMMDKRKKWNIDDFNLWLKPYRGPSKVQSIKLSASGEYLFAFCKDKTFFVIDIKKVKMESQRDPCKGSILTVSKLILF